MSLLSDPVELHPLPPAPDDRWRPTRAGLVNLWRYWDETFEFHAGRLLLRGPNGSGKSMALELLLPFLLDGDASPGRLTSAAKSRGGLFERVMTGTTDATRTGFAWVELRRGDDTFTVGARIRASSSNRSVDRALFTTTQVIGRDLHLLDDARVPLARRALQEAIGTHGRVTDSASEHRDAVRAALFPDFSADRYDALLNALLALRKEKLSQHLDLDKLSDVMSEALPAIDDAEIAAVAEGFERLDRRRDELTLLERDVAEVDAVSQRQRAYARAVVASVAADVRKAESARDGVVRRQRRAADELDEVAAAITELEAEDARIGRRLVEISGEVDGIRSTDLYREGAQLAELQADLRRRRSDRERLQADAAAREGDVVQARQVVEEERARAEQADGNVREAERALRVVAEAAGAGATLDQAVTAGSPDEGRTLLAAWSRERRSAIAEVRRLLTDHDRAVDRRRHAEEQRERARERVDVLTTERRHAEQALDSARAAFVAAVAQWAEQSGSLDDRWRQAVLDAVGSDAPVEGVASAIAGIRSEAVSAAAVLRAELDARRSAITEEVDGLDAERRRLEAGGLPEVESPSWRSPRDGRAGAPLWQLVEVGDGTPTEVVDGLERALVGAGLADAWVAPSGAVDLPGADADIVLAAADARAGNLRAHLRPADGCAIDADVVTGVLEAIAVAPTADDVDAPVVLGMDGTFRLGTAGGRGPAQPATLLGAVARERHRHEALRAVEEQLDQLHRQARAVDDEVRDLDARQALLDADLDVLPPPARVASALAAANDAEVRLGEADAARATAEEAVRAAEAVVRDAQRALASRAGALRLPSDPDELDAIGAAVGDVDEAADTWRRRADELATAQRAVATLGAALDRAERAAADVRERFAAVDADVEQLAAKVAAVGSSIGKDFQQLTRRLEELGTEQAELGVARSALAEQRPALDRRHGKAESDLETATAELAAAEAERAETHERLIQLVDGPLPSDAGVDRPDGPLEGVKAVLEHARAVAAALADVDVAPEVIEKLSLQVERRLHDARAAVGVRIDLERHTTPGGWHVLRGSTGGMRHALGELRAHLHRQLVEARAELHQEEAALFERTLAGSIRHALADRIRGANALVTAINRQLSAVQTAAGGVGVRLRWDVDDDQPDAVRAARALLLRDPADLDETERQALHDFVRARVDQARAELELHAPWEARLRESLDYRAWHRFTLQLSHRDWDGYRPATPRLLQRLSTGERSIALHLPMLASIAAHYTGPDGEPGTGPRLILLDELFAGVDAANRSQLFGTFTEWDLDAVFTSDHEWCQYASLDGIAIHHLHGGADDEPVTSTRFTWDGRQRVLADTGG
jgi:uncharacterized protein (TIGR02680 family)